MTSTGKSSAASVAADLTSQNVRFFGWIMLALMAAFLINNFLTNGAGLPGPTLEGGLGLAQIALYPIALMTAIFYVIKTASTSLRSDSEFVSSINTYFIRAAFWAVLFIGLADTAISFLRIEGLLEFIVGEDMAKNLGRSQFRGPYIHMPLLLLGIIVATRTKTLGFHWLALLIVAAELLIVFSRFIFSYEQAFMADLVRFWYGALFLFASAYTLLEEGHVRVDVFYAGFKEKTKGYVNAVGSVLLGIILCWVILYYGMVNKSSIINSPVFNFEVSQSGFGLYVKYLMAAFLGVFAVSMMIQFVSYLFASVADIRDEPGKYVPQAPGAH